jgi:N-acyl-D-amino-acid deacylase
MFAQVHSRALTVVLSFRTNLPFDRLPSGESCGRCRSPSRSVGCATQISGASSSPPPPRASTGGPSVPRRGPQRMDWIFVMDTPEGPHRSIAEVTGERGVEPVEAIIDLALEKNLDRLFLQPIANEDQDDALELMRHPRTVVTFSDSGAHASQIMDASLQTHLLSYWVRARQAFTLEQAVRMLSFEPASHWGFADRGLIREGMATDLIVFDPETVGPEMPEVVHDLPAGARRLVQRARGFAATVVNGEVLLRDDKHTGALPGELLRGPLARTA